MDGDFFFVLGIVLVLAATAISFVGIRGSDSFPPSRGVLVGGRAHDEHSAGAADAEGGEPDGETRTGKRVDQGPT